MNDVYKIKTSSPIFSAVRYHHLLWGFVSRAVKGRFAGLMGGFLWIIFSPLANILVYFFIFSIIFKIKVVIAETGTSNFLIFFLAGYCPWLILAESLTYSTGILIQNTSTITRVIFPVELLPLSAVLSSTLLNIFGFFLFLAYIALAGFGSITWAYALPVLLLQIFFTIGIAFFLSALNVFIRDVQEMLPIIIMIWFHVTPIIYPLSLVPEAARPILLWNPMAMFVLLYRDAFLLHQLHWVWLLRVTIMAAASYLIGTWFFMRARPAFGDVL